ncbi:hypothetical protein BU16DRAFT_554623 [Lophium mytilinum]|uniref:Uncharacterized protein n=1 Tax=Lophium mytilinum TaxID=390894 RepID=A0A6A6RCH1_9PEZI|nr:hypothetical protein BU16DRAFT_554623 [Lophium mytilinum]
MNDNTTEVDEISTTIEKISDLSCKDTPHSEGGSLSFSSTLAVKKEFSLPHEVDAALFSEQSWICKADSVRHRLRGILITHDTYDLFRLSFESDPAARSFLGKLLVAMSRSGEIKRMSELQLEEINSNWDETARPSHPQFQPVDLPVIVGFKVIFSLSSRWEIVKTLHYIALSQEILNTLCEDAICNSPLTPLLDATYSPMVTKVPYLRDSQQRCSAERELKSALEHSSLEQDDNSVSSIIQRLVELVMVGRRERSEPFLNLSEITIPRLLPRESMENLSRAIKVACFQTSKPDQSASFETRGIRVFLFRRLIGTTGKGGLDEALTKSLQETASVDHLINRGSAPVIQLDKYADGLLDQAKKRNLKKADGEVHKPKPRGIAEMMFSDWLR